ncbi:MAG TPA: hypothetical protein VGQ21_15315 [Thermoanaerobaculia bacterium]|jgi:hypothetical protein|nr:hypothetical protein [Thermoanaerobaculia bacterium]
MSKSDDAVRPPPVMRIRASTNGPSNSEYGFRILGSVPPDLANVFPASASRMRRSWNGSGAAEWMVTVEACRSIFTSIANHSVSSDAPARMSFSMIVIRAPSKGTVRPPMTIRFVCTSTEASSSRASANAAIGRRTSLPAAIASNPLALPLESVIHSLSTRRSRNSGSGSSAAARTAINRNPSITLWQSQRRARGQRSVSFRVHIGHL